MTDAIAGSAIRRSKMLERAGRRAYLDRMRGFVIGLVVVHHAILAYCTFGHVDRANYVLSTAPIVDTQRWFVFDVPVRLNDAFFMPLLFLLSGLFVWDGLKGRGVGAFLRARVRRLGLPFVVAVLTIVPLAYYPSFLQAGGRPGFGAFWIWTVSGGPWPSGPPWFIAVLMIFDAFAALFFALSPRRAAGDAMPHRSPRPLREFLVLLGGSLLVYLPMLLAVGPERWFGVGPCAVQGSRIGLYAAYFAAGVGLGRRGKAATGLWEQAVAPNWRSWAWLAAATGAGFIAVGIEGSRPMPHLWALAVTGVIQAAFCAAAAFALPAFFLRFGEGRSRVWDSLAANSFAIYLLHYPFVTWTQYGLLSLPWRSPAKGAITAAAALLGSWAAAAMLRRLPAFDRVL